MLRILLAEDDASISRIMCLTLQKIGGHTVDLAVDGAKALEKAYAGTYDLILLDGMMPQKDGLTVCRELHQQNGFNTPIIFLSAKSQESDIREVLEAGAIGYITKPFDPRTICDQIQNILNQSQVKAA